MGDCTKQKARFKMYWLPALYSPLTGYYMRCSGSVCEGSLETVWLSEVSVSHVFLSPVNSHSLSGRAGRALAVPPFPTGAKMKKNKNNENTDVRTWVRKLSSQINIFFQQVWVKNELIAMKFYTDIHSPRKMKPVEFDDHLPFSSSTTSRLTLWI